MAVLEMDGEMLEKTIASGQVFLADFWADWCSPCTMLRPVLEQLAEDYDGRVVVGSVDADAEGYLAMQMGIMALPTVIIYKDGIEMDRVMGVNPYELYARLLDDRLSAEQKIEDPNDEMLNIIMESY